MIIIMFLFFILCCNEHDTPTTESFKYYGFIFDVPINWTKTEKINIDGSFQVTWETVDAELAIWMNSEPEQIEAGDDYIIKINGEEITAKKNNETIIFYFDNIKIIVTFVNTNPLNYWVLGCLQNIEKIY